MDEDCRNAFGILMCTEIRAGAGICDCAPSTCSSSKCILLEFLPSMLSFFYAQKIRITKRKTVRTDVNEYQNVISDRKVSGSNPT